MNILKKLQFAWQTRNTSEGLDNPSKDMNLKTNINSSLIQNKNDFGSNVIPLPTPSLSEREITNEINLPFQESPTPVRFRGLLNTPELEDFFQKNFFGFGRHNGSKFRSLEILEQEKQSIVSQFQNKLVELIERKQEKIKKLENEIIGIEGISLAMCDQLKLACKHLHRDIDLLSEQIEAATNSKGWILDPLQRYHNGYTIGIREAIAFDLIAN